MGFFSKLFGKKQTPKEFTEEELDRNYEEKQAGLERVLGKMNEMVGHSIIPFELGGSLDMYYFSNGIPGTGFASMELLSPDGSGPIPNRTGTYELVSFTKEAYESDDKDSNFKKIQGRLNVIMTNIASYSYQAKLEPRETAELPGDEGQPNYCLLFDEYKPNGQEFRIGERKHGLLLVMEIFKDEMEYARKNGSDRLIEKLKLHGYYPYSDLNRKSVLN
jgi:hypothetical protein